MGGVGACGGGVWQEGGPVQSRNPKELCVPKQAGRDEVRRPFRELSSVGVRDSVQPRVSFSDEEDCWGHQPREVESLEGEASVSPGGASWELQHHSGPGGSIPVP